MLIKNAHALPLSVLAAALCSWPRASAVRSAGAAGGAAPLRGRMPRLISPAIGCPSSAKTGSSAWSRPDKGVYETLTLNTEGRRIGDTWDPAKDEAAGEQCRAYGAANIMRLPGAAAYHLGKRQHTPYRHRRRDADPSVPFWHAGSGKQRTKLAGIFGRGMGICTGRRRGGRGGAAAPARQAI